MRLELSRTIAGGHAGAVRLTTPSLGTGAERGPGRVAVRT
jgi:hypothetical protein